MKKLIVLSLFVSNVALAWGERGHHTVGYVAALVTNTVTTAEEKKLLGGFFAERPTQMGHLNNMPDISWKDRTKISEFFRKLNAPTHYLDSEALFGVPEKEYDEAYLSKVRSLEKDYKSLLAKYEGKPSPLPGTESGKIKIYNEVGTAPWRTQELFDQMVAALECSRKPKSKSARKNKTFRSPFQLAKDKSAKNFVCEPSSTREENIYAAIVYAGVMGHFVADLGQPYHCTADYNGWVTGQGGVHEYFETETVLALNQNLISLVTDAATSNNGKIWKALGGDPSDKHFAVQTTLNLAADSLKYLREIQKIDREIAVIKEGDKIPWGGKPGKVKAKRKSLAESKAPEKFEKIIVARLSTSAVALGNLWVAAWRKAGSPDLSDIDLIAVPYPLDVPFLKPAYAPAKLD